MTEVPKPLDTALDLLVYAPVGLAVTAAEELPKLAAKGRTRVNTQLTMARVVGQFAVARGRQELEKRFAPPAPGPAPTAKPSTRPPVSTDLETGHAGAAPADADGSSGLVPGAGPADRPAPPSSELAIPGYDSLSASQVVQRLAGLSDGERAAVAAYEQAHRGRRTILNRIDQLQGQ